MTCLIHERRQKLLAPPGCKSQAPYDPVLSENFRADLENPETSLSAIGSLGEMKRFLADLHIDLKVRSLN